MNNKYNQTATFSSRNTAADAAAHPIAKKITIHRTHPSMKPEASHSRRDFLKNILAAGAIKAPRPAKAGNNIINYN
jgi:hypothetical protein